MDAVYVSANQLRTAFDRTSEFTVGRRVKANCGADGYKYSAVASSAFSEGSTTVVLNEFCLTSNLTEVHYGIIQSGAEGSFPDHMHTAEEGGGGTLSGIYSLDSHNHASDYSNINHNHDSYYSQAAHQHPFTTIPGAPTYYSDGKYLVSTATALEWGYGPVVFTSIKEELSGGLVTEIWGDNTGDLNPGFLEDTHIFEVSPNTNYSDSTTVKFAKKGYTDEYAALFRFKLKDLIGGSNVTSAKFKFYTSDGTAKDQTLYFHRVLQDWVESEVTYNNFKTGSAWHSPGARSQTSTPVDDSEYFDRGPQMISFKAISSSVWVTVDITGVVQDWVSGNHKEYGIMIAQENLQEYTESTMISTTGTDGFRPQLEISYYSGPVYSSIDLTDGQIAVTQDDNYNVYILHKDASLWVVKDGNRYDDEASMPDGEAFEINIGTKVYRKDIDRWFVWGGSAWDETSTDTGTFISLSDTPTTYSGASGKYLRATESGIEFAEVEGGSSGGSSFLSLTDTPVDYYAGKYLRSTSSGIVFADGTVATTPDLVESDFYAYELVQEWNLNNEGINVDLEWDGDVDDVVVFEVVNAAIPAGSNVKLRFNNDTGYNYQGGYITQDGTVYSASYNTSIDKLIISNSNNIADSSRVEFYLSNTGQKRVGRGHLATQRSDNTDLWWTGIYGHFWNNTTDKVTSIQIWTDNADLTGTFRLYKYKKVGLPVNNQFINLTDTPTTYSDSAGKYLRATSSGVEFAEVETGVSSFLNLTDTPGTYSGQAKKAVVIDTTESGIAFVDVLYADGSVELAGDMLPDMTSASGVVSIRDIGSPTQKFRHAYIHDLYVDAGSLYVNGKKVLEDVSNTIIISTDADQDLKIRTTGTGDVLIQSDNEINLNTKGGVEVLVPADNSTKHVNFTNQSVNGNITFSADGANGQVQFAAADEIDLTAPNIDINGDVNISGNLVVGGASTSGASSFLSLTDTPTTYSGQSGKSIVVNDAEDGVKLVEVIPGGKALDAAKMSVTGGAQSWPSGAAGVKVLFDTISFNVGGIANLSESRMDIASSGRYFVYAQGRSSILVNTSTVVTISIFVNGTKVEDLFDRRANATSTFEVQISTVLDLQESDYVELQLYQDDGDTKTIGFASLTVVQMASAEGSVYSSLIELLDTPTTYSGSAGKYLRSTESGIEFADVQSGPSTFLDLIGTPADYDAGKYLRSTSSGIEFAEVETGASSFLSLTDTPTTFSGGRGKIPRIKSSEDGLEFISLNQLSSQEDNIYGWELVVEYNLSNETLDETITGIKGDTDSEWLLEGGVVASDSSGVSMQLNGDTGNNYHQLAFSAEYNDDAMGYHNEVASSYMAAMYHGNKAGYAFSRTHLNLKSGNYRHALIAGVCENDVDVAFHVLNGYSCWKNTVDEVTTMRLYSSVAYTGSIKVYKQKKLSLPVVRYDASLLGVQSIGFEYYSTTHVQLNPGICHVNDNGVDRFFTLAEKIQVTETYSADTWYYIYLDPSVVVGNLDADDFVISSDEPSEQDYGYYHPTSTNWRCMGCFTTHPAGSIRKWYNVNGFYYFSGQHSEIITQPNGVWTDVSLPVPSWTNGAAAAVFRCERNQVDESHFHIRRSSDDGQILVARVNSYSKYEYNTLFFPYKEDGSIQVNSSSPDGGLNYLIIYVYGYAIPEKIYSGVKILHANSTVSDIPFEKGKQSIQVEYKSATEVYLNPGIVHVASSANPERKMFELEDRTTISGASFSADTWYYIYVDVDNKTTNYLQASDFSFSSTEPVKDYSKKGYYNGNKRCVGFINSDAIGNILEFAADGRRYQILPHKTITEDWHLMTAEETYLLPVPIGGIPCVLHLFGRSDIATEVSFYAGNPDFSSRSIIGISVTTSNNYATNTFTNACSGDKRVSISSSANSKYILYLVGFECPVEIFN